MELFESIYFLIMFTVPAAINIVYNVHFARVNRLSKDSTVMLAENVVFCLCVFGINCLIMKNEIFIYAQYLVISDVADQTEFLNNTGLNPLLFALKYFMYNFGVSILCAILWTSVGRLLLGRIKNRCNNVMGRDKEEPVDSVWEIVFESRDRVDINNSIVCIVKDGKVLTAGTVAIYPPPNDDQKSFLLYNTDSVMQEFEEDKKRSFEERLFPYAQYEYYDMERDLLLKFYDDSKYYKAYEKPKKEEKK